MSFHTERASWRGQRDALRQAKGSSRKWLRYGVAIAFAAIGAFIGALPAAAGCVSSSACSAGGGMVIMFGGHAVCSGGSQAGSSICSGPGGINPLPFLTPGSGNFDSDRGSSSGGGRAPNLRSLGGPVYFSMYSSDTASGPYANADVFGVHNSGYRISDSAGAIAPGSLAPGFNSVGGGGGANLTFDATRALDVQVKQQLLFGVNVDYQRMNTNYGTSALTPGVSNAGSERSDIWTFSGSVDYSSDRFYATGLAAYNLRHSDITNNVITPGAEGSTGGQGYTLNATAGYLLPLIGSSGVTPSAIPTKAMPSRIEGYSLFLDVKGNLGYQKQWNNGFTDNTGFAYGTEQFSYTDLGGKVRLVAVVPSAGFSWMPYVGAGVDQLLGFSHTFEIPVQAATTADTIFFGQSTTFWTVQAGLNIINRASLQAGVTGFYSASADTSIFGGNVFVKIPFYADVAPVGDSGIRSAK